MKKNKRMNQSAKKPLRKNIITRILGSSQSFDLEHRFFNSVVFIAALIGLIALMANIILELGVVQIVSTIIAVILFSIMYYISRVKRKIKYLYPVFFITAFGILTNMWFANAGLQGPVPYILFLLYAVIFIIITNIKQKIFVLVLSNLLIVALIVIEYYYPENITCYKNRSVQYMDMAISLFYCLLLICAFIAIIMKNFNDSRMRAEQSDKLKSNFLANMSHEIRTPLNGIIGFAELLVEPGLSIEKRKEYIEIIDQNSNHLISLIDDILDISKIEAGYMKIEYQKVNVNILIAELASFFTPDVKKKSEGKVEIKLNCELPVDQSTISTSQLRLKQILINLIKNSIKFTKSGYIEIGYTIERDLIKFFVRDTGKGLTKDQQNYIFDRFMQADSQSVTYEKGSGLGLTITKSFIELLGGKIWVESEEDKGTTFYFTLPFKTELNSNKTAG